MKKPIAIHRVLKVGLLIIILSSFFDTYLTSGDFNSVDKALIKITENDYSGQHQSKSSNQESGVDLSDQQEQDDDTYRDLIYNFVGGAKIVDTHFVFSLFDNYQIQKEITTPPPRC